jgi:cytoskeletal protein CcmA (bactofilin family)
MSLKENFYQALRELLNHGGLVGSDLEDKAKSGSDLDSFIETARNTPVPDQGTAPEVKPFVADAGTNASVGNPSDTPNNFWKVMTERKDATKQDEPYQTFRSQAVPPNADGFPSSRPSEETTIISKNSFVDGNIRSFANVTIEGSVRGKVDVMKDVSMQGLLVGNLSCNNADMQGSSVQGNIFTKGNAFVDNDSVLLGNLSAQYASVDGKVKGDMEIGSKGEFGANAIVLGNIKTGTISVADGANIQGYVNTAFLMEHGDTAFPNEVVIDDMGM